MKNSVAYATVLWAIKCILCSLDVDYLTEASDI